MGLNLHEVVGSFPISQALLSVSPSSSEKIPVPDHPLFFGTLGGCLIILFPSGYTCPRFYMRMLPSVGGWGGGGGWGSYLPAGNCRIYSRSARIGERKMHASCYFHVMNCVSGLFPKEPASLLSSPVRLCRLVL